MDFIHINPHIRVAIHIKKLDDFSLLSRKHYNYDCRIFYFLDGTGICSIGNSKYKITPGLFVYIPPGNYYSFDVSPDIKYYVLDFDLTDEFADMKDSLGVSYGAIDKQMIPQYVMQEEFKRTIVHKSEKIREYIKNCVEEFSSVRKYYRSAASSALKTGFIELMREIELSDSRTLANNVIEYVRENYHNPYISNKDIAEHFGYHPYYISNLVKSTTGVTLRKFIIKHRLREAKKLLTSTKLSMSEIAEKSGFQSATYFNELFKDYNGVTLLTYRKIHKHM